MPSAAFLDRLGVAVPVTHLEPVSPAPPAPAAAPPAPAPLPSQPALTLPEAEPARFFGIRQVVFHLASERGFPDLWMNGKHHGRGRKLWERFCRDATDAWMPFAESALRAKEPIR